MAINAGDEIVAADLSPGEWIALDLQNGWAPRTGYFTPSYRLLSDSNEVEFAGGMIDGTATNGTVIANLPAGYRPAYDQPAPVVANNGYTIGVFVRSSGDVELFHFEGTSPSFSAVYFVGSIPLEV